MFVNIMQPYELTVDKCRDYLIFMSLAENMQERGGDFDELTFESREFIDTRERVKKDKRAWRELRETARTLLRKIKRLNDMSVPDIFEALDGGDEEVRAAISARLILRRLDGAVITLPDNMDIGEGESE